MKPPFRLHPAVAVLVLALAVLATQAGGLWREVIDPDESTFILMGADVARGHLPFVDQFDLKPPMIFALIGAVLSIFGKSLVAVRLLGDAFLFGTAWLTFLTARRISSDWAALGGALAYLCFASLELGQPTYSELPALFFAMAALTILIRQPVTPRGATLAGMLMALAVLSRTNLYPFPIVFGLALLIGAMAGRQAVHPAAWAFFALGGLMPVGLLIGIYAAAGHLNILRLAMIDVPLSYAAQMGPGTAMIENARQLYVTATMEPLIVLPFTGLSGLGCVLLLARLAYPASSDERWILSLLGCGLLAAAVSLIVTGAVYPHYWLQVLPFLAIAAALGLDLVRRARGGAWAAAALVMIPVAAALTIRVPQALHRTDTFDIAATARFITQSGGSDPQVWAWRKQLISWYLDVPALSKAGVQPENIARVPITAPLAAQGYVSTDEVGRLLTLKPQFVVTDRAGKGSAWLRAADQPIDAWLIANYALAAQFGDVLVYRRISLPLPAR